MLLKPKPTPKLSPSVPALVKELKEAGEDYEFYPTTPAIINCVLEHHGVASTDSLEGNWRGVALDIGAGHGAFLKAFGAKNPSAELLAIEKSPILMAELVKFAKVVGTDFYAQSFTTKNVGLAFCNPPYSDYATWTTKLIRECPAADLYLVIPERWKNNPEIAAAIKFVKARVKVIGSFDFLDAERQARAKVDVLYVSSLLTGDDRFKAFFFEHYGDHLNEDAGAKKEAAKEMATAERTSLVQRDGLISALVSLYDQEMDRIQKNYDLVAKVDPIVLTELQLDISAVITALRARLDGLKNDYWTELFGHLDSVTKRLTSKNRKEMLNTIGGFKAVDFSRENIYAVLLWVIEHANHYADQQVLDVFDSLVDSANIVNYKSNQRVYGNGHWRYGQKPENLSHISLDYRIVLQGYRGMQREYWGSRLSDGGRDLLMDLHTVANLLGFECVGDDPRLTESNWGESKYWTPGEAQLFQTVGGTDLVEARAFLNGNMHLRLSQKFVMALNVAVGRLRGWLRDHSEATEEFGKDAEAAFEKDFKLKPRQAMLAFTPAKAS